MNYTESINYIHSTPKFSRVLGNSILVKLLEKLGNPHEKLKFIHLAGTNGKGSTSAFIAEILKEAGYRVGLFTSPFIEVYNERIQINGVNIDDDTLARLTTTVRLAMEKHDVFVSEFALATAICFLYFAENNCDYVVLETGMGGALDATNVISSAEVVGITSISLDHTQYLGDTIEKIAKEKGGIIKDGNTVVCYCCQNEAAADVIKNECELKNATFMKSSSPSITDSGFLYNGIHYEIGLRGSYQPYNAVLAIEIVNQLIKKGADISGADIYNGIKNTRWMARFEFLRDNLIIDGSHNIDGVATLCQSLEALNKKVVLVVAMMEDKDFTKCVRAMSDVANYMIFTRIDMPRCANPETLVDLVSTPSIVVNNPIDAVHKALQMIDDDGVVCVCGSLYLAGEVRKIFK